MGCGCKGDNNSLKNIDEEKNELNLIGKILKIPTALLVTLIIVIISPFLIVYVWYIAIRSIYGKDSNIVNGILGRFNKKDKVDEEVEINEDEYDYVLENVDIINNDK